MRRLSDKLLLALLALFGASSFFVGSQLIYEMNRQGTRLELILQTELQGCNSNPDRVPTGSP